MGNNIIHMENSPNDFSAMIAERIGEAIQSSGRSILSVSTETGISHSTLTRRVKSKGASPFTVTELDRITTVLGLNLISLLEDAKRLEA
jgi:hypothetical protein